MWKASSFSLLNQFPKVFLPSSIFHSRITSNTLPTIPPPINTHHLFSTKSHLCICKSVISRCPHLWENKVGTFAENSSLHDILKQYGHLSPDTTRRFWRVSALKPNDFLEILMGFGPDVKDLKKIGFLWNLFRWAGKQFGEFSHLSKSFEIMGTMLIRARMFKDAESLVLSVGDCSMFSDIIQGYVEDLRLQNSLLLYDRAKERGLLLFGSCYKALLDLLIRMEEVEIAVRVYADMIEAGLWSCSEDRILEFVVGALSRSGKTLDAVTILRKLKNFGVEPSPTTLTAIVEGYRRKKDYDDMLNFMKEWNHIPEACVCNKIVSSLCRDLGIENAWSFTQRLEARGFELDAITFVILISQSCSERKLRNAIIYLSEAFSRGIKLQVHACNALVSGLFKEGMHSCAKDVSEEMVENGIISVLSTFKILLAGYCKYRKFDEAKQVLGEMINRGMTSLAPLEDDLTKVFQILCLDHLRVKVKRDNNLGLAKAEFFDSLGNGLYLDTDVEKYDKTLEEILDNGIIPDFDSLILEECCKGDIKTALRMRDEAIQWGIDLSLSTYPKLVENLCASSSYIKSVVILVDENSEILDQLGFETLNLLIQYLSNNAKIARARSIMDRLFKRQMPVESDTYTALILGLCKEKNVDGLRDFLQAARKNGWLPGLMDVRVIVSFQCKYGMIMDVLEIFVSGIENYSDPNLMLIICNAIVKELCSNGFTDIGNILVEQSLLKGHTVSNETYTSLIEGFIKEKKFTKAIGIVDRVLEKNKTLDVSIYQLTLPYLSKLNGAEKAMSAMQNMLNAQYETVLVHSILVNELCTAGKVKEATIQLHEMLRNKNFPDNNTLNALIQGFCRVQLLRQALEILAVMLRHDSDLSISGFRSLMLQFCAHGQVIEALSLEKLMLVKSDSQQTILHNILIFYLFQSGNRLLVDAVLKKMLEKNMVSNPDTYNILIYGFYNCGNASRSVKLLNTMITEGMKPNNRALRTVICYLCSRGEVKKALELSKVMEHEGWKHGSVVLYALAEGLLQRGEISMAKLFLDRMEVNDMIPNNVNLDLLIKKFCVHGCIKKAVDLLNVMLKKGNRPSDISYSLIIKALSIRKLFDQAIDFHAEMMYYSLQPSLDSCNALIYGLCDAGRTDDSRKILGEMLHFGPVPTRDMYNHVIDKYHVQSNLDKASELLQEMQRAGYSPNFETYWSLISNLSCSDKKEDDDDVGKSLEIFIVTRGHSSTHHKNIKPRMLCIELTTERSMSSVGYGRKQASVQDERQSKAWILERRNEWDMPMSQRKKVSCAVQHQPDLKGSHLSNNPAKTPINPAKTPIVPILPSIIAILILIGQVIMMNMI